MLNRNQVNEILAPLNGNTFIGLTATTIPKLTGGKKNDMQGEITKRTVSVVQVFQNKSTNGYENKRLKANPDFKLGDRPWGTRVKGTPFIEHKGADYMEVIFVSTDSVDYFRNGEPIEKDQIVGLPASRPAGDTDNVIIRTYKLESIDSLRAFGAEYTA